jgi:hypothetical protein
LTCWTLRIFFWTISHTKWRSIWMCFIRECWTGLKLRCVALRLSHSSRGGVWIGRQSSLNRDNNQTVSDVAVASERYSASVDVTTFADADWVGNYDDRTSTLAYITFLGINPIS